MSHNPPPPPYGYGPPAYPPHLAPPTYAYIPTPVMMPMPSPYPPVDHYGHHSAPPTYVTNYIYQARAPASPPVESVRVAEIAAPSPDPIEWVPATTQTATSLAHRAFVAGKEGWDSSPLWIIRAPYSGDLIPGKYTVKHRAAYIAHGGKEIPVHNFEVLCVPALLVRWLPSSNGQVPVGAIPAGNTHSSEPLYIGRAKHMRSMTPGKVHPSHGSMYIPFGGSEVAHKRYEVLCKIVG